MSKRYVVAPLGLTRAERSERDPCIFALYARIKEYLKPTITLRFIISASLRIIRRDDLRTIISFAYVLFIISKLTMESSLRII